ncbi:R protein [gamma proteobacterium HTCC5015]|nr:R protein [gamma proteobacterium HTCC5015]
MKSSAAQAAAEAEAQQPQTGDAYELMFAALVEDRRRLKDIQSIERKIELKAELLPNYESYVLGVLEEGSGAQDDVLMTVMIWCLDVGRIDLALNIGEYAMEHELKSPEAYQREVPSILVEELADHYLRNERYRPKFENGDLIVPDEDSWQDEINQVIQHLKVVDRITEHADMHDQIRAKHQKALGWAYSLTGQFDAALESLNRALQLDKNAGVKKDIERLQKLRSSS